MYDERELDLFRSDSGLERYRMPIRYPVLGKYRIITSDMPLFVVHKAAIQEMQWAAQWEHRSELKKRRLGLEMNAKRNDLNAAQKRKIAEARTAMAQEEFLPIKNLLSIGLNRSLDVDWSALKHYPDYPFPAPESPQYPARPALPALLREPLPTDEAYLPAIDPMDKMIRGRREEKERAAQQKYQVAHRQWEEICQRMAMIHREQLRQYTATVQQMKAQHDHAMAQWQQMRERYIADREQCLPVIDAKSQAYLLGEPYAVLDHCDLILSQSPYPDYIPHSFDLDYFPAEKGLLVEYLLPPLRVFPRLKGVQYIESNNTFRDVLMSDEERNTLYANALYELPLRTLHELFQGDVARAVKRIRIDGYIFLDEHPTPGQPPTCVLSIELDKETFMQVDLHKEDPITAFNALGGVFHSAG